MAKKRRKKKVATKKVIKRGRRGGRRAEVAAPKLGGAMENLSAALADLVAERDRLNEAIATIESLVGGSAPAARAVGRPVAAARSAGGHRAGSLKEYVDRVLRGAGGVMTVKDITDGVLRAGYKTKNKTLAKSVGIALTEMSNVTKVGRGQFRIK